VLRIGGGYCRVKVYAWRQKVGGSMAGKLEFALFGFTATVFG
jgi:hypothetical protein